ncbi:MAG: hypothetical protein JSS49_01205 [Planctomycetes bacterium]|nr:hypothetical protein [Planctomycetota bacterium]
MGSFFRGWRRKAGCFTLVIACAFWGLWTRSFREVDQIHFVRDSQTLYALYSCPAGLGWSRLAFKKTRFLPPYNDLSFTTFHYTNHNAVYPYGWSRDNWGDNWYGYRFGTSYSDFDETQVRIIRHWQIVIPLTLLSTGLILWTPRPVPPQTHERLPNRNPDEVRRSM